ncbi:DUF4115 domain-containing protein [Anaerolineales bacterium HSG24]|nr:DUF4115 domain-containing protein [Anaerolineales bacterium HSG24]
MSLGEILKATREEKGLSHEQVEEVLRIRVHLLHALEEDNFEVFPSPIIARGLIRNYSKYLGLDPIEALTMYDGKGVVFVKGQRANPVGSEFRSLSTARRPIPWDIIVGLAMLLLVIGAGGYWAYSQFSQIEFGETGVASAVPLATVSNDTEHPQSDDAFTLDTPTPLPTNTPTPIPPSPTPTPVIYTGVTVELIIREASWVQISVDDVQVFEGILQTNESRSWTGDNRVEIRAGNAGGVELIVNGVNQGLMGASGQVDGQIWEKVNEAPQ